LVLVVQELSLVVEVMPQTVVIPALDHCYMYMVVVVAEIIPVDLVPLVALVEVGHDMELVHLVVE
jgi:hypothetical protein